MASVFGGEHLQVGKQTCRFVIAGRIATLDFVLDLAPNAATALPENPEPGTARFFGFFGFPTPLRLKTLGLGAFIGLPDLLRPYSQLANSAIRRGRGSLMLIADCTPEFGRNMAVAFDKTRQDLRLFVLGDRRQRFAQGLLGYRRLTRAGFGGRLHEVAIDTEELREGLERPRQRSDARQRRAAGIHPQSNLPLCATQALHSRLRISVFIQSQNCRTTFDSERRL